MTGPFPGRVLLPMWMAASVLGCAAKLPEKPIVLRPHHPKQRLVHQPPPAAPAEPATLSPGEKENLFRDFDDYLSRNAKPAGNPP